MQSIKGGSIKALNGKKAGNGGMSMEMKKNELARRYKEAGSSARDKRAQIKILAELNGCTEENVMKALAEAGIKEDELPKKPGPKKEAQGGGRGSRAEKPQKDRGERKEDAADSRPVPAGMPADKEEADMAAAMLEGLVAIQDKVREQIERKEEAFEKVTEAIRALRRAGELLEK